MEYSNFVSGLTLLCPSHASDDAAPTFSTGESFLGGSYKIVIFVVLVFPYGYAGFIPRLSCLNQSVLIRYVVFTVEWLVAWRGGPYVVGAVLDTLKLSLLVFADYNKRGGIRMSFVRSGVSGTITRGAVRASVVRGSNGVLGPEAVGGSNDVSCVPVSS